MGTNRIKHNRIARIKELACRAKHEETGDAVVEATVIFPVMIMIFAALVLISVYLPGRALLQWSAGYAATVIAAEMSDTWVGFDEEAMSYYWIYETGDIGDVYTQLFENNNIAAAEKGERITEKAESRGINSKNGDIYVTCQIRNNIIYKEVTVEAMREYTVPVNLSIIGFPQKITVTAASTAISQNADEFIRNADMATDFVKYTTERYGTGDMENIINDYGRMVKNLFR